MVKIRNIFLVCTIIVCIGLPGVAQIHHSYFSNYTIRNGLADVIHVGVAFERNHLPTQLGKTSPKILLQKLGVGIGVLEKH